MAQFHSSTSPQSISRWSRLWAALKDPGTAGLAVISVLILIGTQVNVRDSQTHTPAPSNVQQASVGIQAAHVIFPPDGEQIYQTRCMSCHQMNGQGVSRTFPPLQETEWVTGDKGRLIRIILGGVTGSIEVKGSTYQGVMPPWGSALNDKEVAALASYVRSNFGNDASSITAEEVARVRKVTKERAQPWTAQELQKEANQGIPGDSTAAE